MMEFQGLHDNDLGTSNFEGMVEKIANRYKLVYEEAA